VGAHDSRVVRHPQTTAKRRTDPSMKKSRRFIAFLH
jgi:hypothetical protein